MPEFDIPYTVTLHDIEIKVEGRASRPDGNVIPDVIEVCAPGPKTPDRHVVVKPGDPLFDLIEAALFDDDRFTERAQDAAGLEWSGHALGDPSGRWR